MDGGQTVNIAIVFPEGNEVRRNAAVDNNRFADMFRAFAAAGAHAEPAVYHDAFVEAVQILQIDKKELPVLWDCDFLLGQKDEHGADTYVLCEINVSSVAPYPESSTPYIVEATLAQALSTRHRRGASA